MTGPRILTEYEAIMGQWRAWDARLGADTSPYGYGDTEDEAKADLVEKLAETEGAE